MGSCYDLVWIFIGCLLIFWGIEKINDSLENMRLRRKYKGLKKIIKEKMKEENARSRNAT